MSNGGSGVDDRMVSMKFDNATFQAKLSDTIRDLGKLRESLALTGATQGMKDVQTASSNFHLGGMGAAIEGVSGKFLALAAVGITALTNITNKAVDAGLRFVKSFTVAPIMDGFREMETKVGSIQTILANTSAKGTTLSEVEGSLNELNEYADKTIYNFGEMTKNIGLFTNAGIGIHDATSMIKGFSNSAAASGTNAQAAANAAYQLSQALSSGTVRLMDWRSLTNAGMGNKNMQQGLADLAQAMGVMEEKENSATNVMKNFNASLETGWLTSDVMSKYLKIMAGDMSEAEMAALGLSEAQIGSFGKQQVIAEEAATKVRTFTQLIGTAKEAVGSGWSETFELFFGNFDQATELFTNINNVVGGFVKKTSDARNDLIRGWSFMGGRDLLIDAFGSALKNVGNIITQVKDAFREFFPAMDSKRLFEMTQGFAAFVEKIKLGDGALENISQIFRAFFSTLKIGWEIIKGLAGVVSDLFGALFEGGGDAFTDIARGAGSLADFNQKILDSEAIPKFFERLGDRVRVAVGYVKDFIGFFTGIFAGFTGSKEVEDSLQRVGSRLDGIRGFAGDVGSAWERMGERLQGVRDVLDRVWDHIATWFKELGTKLAAVMQPGDFDAAVDVVNVGLLGGIALMLKKFLNGGLSLNFGDGLVEKIGNSFDQLTGTLKTMQADLKAKALLKIAGAVGILTASVVALSMIDSAALTKAMVAMSIGFGQLLGVMTIMDKMNMGTGAIKMNGMATSMILMATAMGVLSMAVTNLSQLGWEELAKGLLGISVMLVAMTGSTQLIAANTSGMVRAGAAMGLIAGAMFVLSEAVKSFADMEWSEMAKGMTGVALGLGIITGAMHLMPTGMAAQGAAIVLIAGAMRLLGEAVEKFGTMDMSVMGQGLLGVAGGLVAIAGAMHLMPTGIAMQSAALVVLSGALNVLAMAVARMGDIAFGEMAKGIGGLAVTLGILAGALHAMTGTLAGAAALTVASGALVILTGVLKELSELKLSELAMGLGAMAAVFAVMGGAAYLLGPLAPALLALGFAVGVVGGAFAIFGGGAMMLGKAFELVAKSGREGAKAVVDIIAVFLTARIKIVQALVGAIIEFANEILQAAPLIIKNVRVLLGHILDTVIELVPKIAKTVATIVTEALKLLRDKVPELVETGFVILLSLLKGIRDNIGEIVTVAADIVTRFMDALSEKVPEIVDSAYNLIFTVLTEVAEKLVFGVPKLFIAVAKAMIDGLVKGLKETFPTVLTWFRELPGKILSVVKELLGIKSPSSKFLDIGTDIITGLFNGLTGAIGGVMTWFRELPGKILGAVGDVTRTLWDKGTNFIGGLLGGIGSKIGEVTTWFTGLAGKVVGWVGDTINTLKARGVSLISGFLSGITERATAVMEWLTNLPGKIFNEVKDIGSTLYNLGKDVIQGLWDGFKDKWKDATRWLSGLDPRRHFNDINPAKGHAIKNLVATGGAVMQGLWNGMKDGWKGVTGWLKSIDPSEVISEPSFNGINDTFNQIVDQLRDLEQFNPVITPVLDLTKVQAASRGLDSMMRVSAIVPEVSIDRAHHIATTAEIESAGDSAPTYTGPTEIKFEQNNYSPTALSTSDIYRNTRSQIALAKEELEIV